MKARLARLFKRWVDSAHGQGIANQATAPSDRAPRRAGSRSAMGRGAAGPAVASVAAAAVMALAGWGVLVVGAAGSQDLWMMVFALAPLLALVRGRPWLAMLGFALALLSKETAAAVPAIALVYLL